VDYQSSVINKVIEMGMNAFEVECSWGKPEDINRTVSGSNVHEQWVYSGGELYVYLDNGIVVSWQD
jgi:hypothetical protein